jgi:hypothetical protein
LHQQDDKNHVAKKLQKKQSEITADMSDPQMSGAFLNSVNSSFKRKKGRVTALVAKARYHKHKATMNQAQQRFRHSTESRPSSTIIKVPLDSGPDGEVMFHEKGTSIHSPYLTRQMPNSWHTLNGSFLTKGMSKVSLKFFEYSNQHGVSGNTRRCRV